MPPLTQHVSAIDQVKRFYCLSRAAKFSAAAGVITFIAGISIFGLSLQAFSPGLNTLSAAGISTAILGIGLAGIGLGRLLIKPRPALTPELIEEMKTELPEFLPGNFVFEGYPKVYIKLFLKCKETENLSYKYNKIFVLTIRGNCTLNFFNPDGEYATQSTSFLNPGTDENLSDRLLIFVLDKTFSSWATDESRRSAYINNTNILNEFLNRGGQILWIRQSDFKPNTLYSKIVNETLPRNNER